MFIRARLIICVLLVSSLVPALLSAQCSNKNGCYGEEDNLFVKPAYRTGWSSKDTKRNELETHTTASTRFHAAQRGFDIVGMLHPMEDLDEQTLAKESEERIGTVTHQLPLMGQQMLQNSQAIRDMLDTSLDGVMTLYKITSHQTEPAEAAGAQGAEMTAALLQNNMYQAQNLMHLQYISDPNMYRNSMTMYSRCMADRTLLNSGGEVIKGQGNGKGKEEYDDKDKGKGSWITALAECLGDNIRVKGGPIAGPEEFHVDKGYSVKNHPAYLAGKGIMPGIKETQIRLTDLLFAELYRENRDDKGNVQNVDKDDTDANALNDLRKSWLELFGDKILKYELPAAGSEYKEFQMLRVGRAVRIQPSKQFGANIGKPHTIAHMVQERADARFKTLREILRYYCETGKNGENTAKDLVHGSVPKSIEADTTEFWTNHPQSLFEDEKEALSLPGAPIQIVVLQGLFDSFTQRFGDDTGTVDCTVLDETNPVEFYNEKDGLGVAVYLEFFSLLRGVAARIAMAQLLQAGIFAQDFVNERASGFGLDPDIREMAMQMISESFNGNGFNGGDLHTQLVQLSVVYYLYKKM